MDSSDCQEWIESESPIIFLINRSSLRSSSNAPKLVEHLVLSSSKLMGGHSAGCIPNQPRDLQEATQPEQTAPLRYHV